MAARRIPVELEAKLLVSQPAQLRAIARLTHIGPYPLRARGAVYLHSTYVDTSHLTLARHGVTVRVRRHGGRWEATLKRAGRVAGDVHERPEWTVQLAGAPALPLVPPEPLRTQLAALVAERPLVPVLVSEIHRRVFDVLPADATASSEPIAELALDRVRLHAPHDRRRQTVYCEVEIERRRGRRRDIVRMARLLRRGFGLVPSSESKFARGMTLLYGADLSRHGGARVLRRAGG